MLKKFRLFFSSYYSIMLICTVQHKLAFKITNKQWIKLIVTRMLYISWYIQNQLVKMNLGDQGVSLTDKIFISKWCENLAKKGILVKLLRVLSNFFSYQKVSCAEWKRVIEQCSSLLRIQVGSSYLEYFTSYWGLFYNYAIFCHLQCFVLKGTIHNLETFNTVCYC